MPKKLFFLLLNIAFASSLNSQTPPEFVTKVYNDLYRNLSINKIVDKPELVYITDDNSKIIEYKPSQNGNKHKLIVGHEFINLMRSFDSDSMNALAFVLGHEMAHIFLEQSDNIERIGGGYADPSLKKQLKQLKDSLYSNIFERQADEWAMFYSHLGGYKTIHIADEVLQSVYEHFDLPEKIYGYPDLSERKTIVQASIQKMNLLLQRYEMANLCLMARNFDLSIKIYDAILKEGFKSSEIYNNLGVGYLLNVIQNDSIFQKYEWPIFIDSKSKLASNSSTRDIFGIDVTAYLNNAIYYFELALRDKDYKNANLNIAIAYLLKEISLENQDSDNLLEFNNYLNKAKNANVSRVKTLEGIFAHHSGKIEESKNLFLSNSEICPISKRNFELLYGDYQNITNSENPLSCLLKFDTNMAELFYVSKGIIKDSSNIGSKPILPSFSNISIESLNSEKFYCSRILDRSANERFYIAELKDQYEYINDELLIEFSDFIFETNLYRYFIYSDWIIRMDSDNIKTFYKFR
jgi:hypothetical protein